MDNTIFARVPMSTCVIRCMLKILNYCSRMDRKWLAGEPKRTALCIHSSFDDDDFRVSAVFAVCLLCMIKSKFNFRNGINMAHAFGAVDKRWPCGNLLPMSVAESASLLSGLDMLSRFGDQ